jgi:acyl-CoA thioesterase FadM
MLINDIDAAGIAYTGRLVTIALEALEEGLARTGLDFASMLREGRLGVPLVHISADFKSPFRHGDQVDIDLCCEDIGERSYTCRVDLLPAGRSDAAASLRFTAAVIDMTTFKATAVPPAIRAALERISPPGTPRSG